MTHRALRCLRPLPASRPAASQRVFSTAAALALLFPLLAVSTTVWADRPAPASTAKATTMAKAAKAPPDPSAPYRLTLPPQAPYRATIPAAATATSSRSFSPGGATAHPGGGLAIQPAIAQRPYAREIAAAAREHGVDAALIHAVVAVESNYHPDARSPKGAQGLMQLMPDTARRYGGRPDPVRPEDNLRAGTRYLRDLLDQFPARLDLALAAYNAGENAVRRYGNRIPPYAETRQYVPAVMTRFSAWRRTPWQIDAAADSAAWHLDPRALAAWRQRPADPGSHLGPLAATPSLGEFHGNDRPDH